MTDRALTNEQEYRLARADEYAWERSRRLGLSRRRFLQLLAAGGMAATMGGELSPAARVAHAAPADSDEDPTGQEWTPALAMPAAPP